MGWSPQCYIPSFVEIGPPVPEKDFWSVFTIYGRGGHLGHVTQLPANKLSFPLPKEAPHKIWLWSATCFREEDVWNCGQRMTDGWTEDRPWVYYIKLNMSLWLRWAKNAPKRGRSAWNKLFSIFIQWVYVTVDILKSSNKSLGKKNSKWKKSQNGSFCHFK